MSCAVERQKVTEARSIAIFLPSLQGGGAERVMVALANGLASRGHRVDLVLAKSEGPYLDEVASSVRLVDLKCARVASSLVPLARYLRRQQPDAMLSALNHANLVAISARKLARVKMRLVISERNTLSRELSGLGKAFVVRSLVKILYRSADRIVCVSNGVERDLDSMLGLPQGRLCTIYNPLDVEKIREKMLEAVPHPWMNGNGSPVILAVGRLAPQKDYPTLLRAFAILRRKRLAKLVILGQGELESDLKSQTAELGISSDVDFVGFQINPLSWMRACALYVMSSAWEGLPSTILQALACEAKIVSTDCPNGPAEILEGGKWGRLTPVGNAEVLAEALNAALDDDAPKQLLKRANDFRSEHIVSMYEQVLMGRG